MEVVLRDYQIEIIDNVRQALREHRSVLLEAPTGSGKSVILAGILSLFHKNILKKEKKMWAYVIVHQKFLLQQMSGHLKKWNVPHGLITAGKYEKPDCHIHVCTIQTLINRPPANYPSLIIIDEAHRSGSISYTELGNRFPNSTIIGVTATPERGDGKSLKSPGGLFDVLLPCPLSMRELTDKGYLCPIKYFAPPFKGLKNVKISKGDYVEEDLQEVMKHNKIYGDAIKHYEKLAQGKQCLVFCRRVESCNFFRKELIEAGYRAVVLDGTQSENKINRKIQMFKDKNITHLVTCKLVLEGVDIPAIECVLDLSPTIVRGLWRQKIGRLVRPSYGKVHGIYIDAVGNALLHAKGDIYSRIQWNFEGRKRKFKKLENIGRHCPRCFYFMGNARVCVNCGYKIEVAELENIQGVQLTEYGKNIYSLDELRKKLPSDSIFFKLEKARKEYNIEKLHWLMMAYLDNYMVADELYLYLTRSKLKINEDTLHLVCNEFGYKPGWKYYARERLISKLHKPTQLQILLTQEVNRNEFLTRETRRIS